MAKSKADALSGAIVALIAILATTRGDLVAAVLMFVVASCFSTWPHREWKKKHPES